MTAGAGRSQVPAAPPAQLGLLLRAVLLAPRRGFKAALTMTARRQRAGDLPAEGRLPVVLTILGGIALMLLWLKIGGITGRRSVDADEFRWAYLVAAAGTGGAIAWLARALWIRLAGKPGRATAAGLRLVWGAASFPQVAGLVFLVPLDLLIVGTRTFTTERLSEPFAAGWAAISIAISVSLAVWSGYLLYVGATVASLQPWRAVAAAVAGLAVSSAVAVGLVVAVAVVA